MLESSSGGGFSSIWRGFCRLAGASRPAERRQLGFPAQHFPEEHHLPADDPHAGPSGRRYLTALLNLPCQTSQFPLTRRLCFRRFPIFRLPHCREAVGDSAPPPSSPRVSQNNVMYQSDLQLDLELAVPVSRCTRPPLILNQLFYRG